MRRLAGWCALDRVMGRGGRILVIALAMLACWPAQPGWSAARAATVPGTADPDRLESALALLRKGDRVRVQTATGQRFQGRLRESGRYGLVFEPPGSLELSADAVERVWVERHQAERGAIAGGLLGLVVGVALGNLANELCDTGNCNETSTLTTLGILGTATGAAVGALVGRVIPRWEQRFP